MSADERMGLLEAIPEANILAGITRDSLIQLAEDLGWQVTAQPISRDQLYMADEVFVCGTAAEVIGLREIDFRTIGSGKTGPITRALQEAYRAAVSGNHPRSAGWLARIDVEGRSSRAVRFRRHQRECPGDGSPPRSRPLRQGSRSVAGAQVLQGVC